MEFRGFVSGSNRPGVEAAFDRLSGLVAAFEKRQVDKRRDTGEKFLSVVKDLETIAVLEQKIYSFCGLYYSEDTQNQEAQNLVARAEQFMAEIGNRHITFHFVVEGS